MSNEAKINEPGIAIITGASSGIGAAFAEKLASFGYDLVLTGRREHLLESLAEKLKEKYSLEVVVLVGDLTNDEFVLKLEDHISSAKNLKLLINNAGYGIGDSFTSDKVPIEKSLDLVKVHVNAPVRFARAAIKNMEKRGEGYIINVASLAAFFPRKGSLYAPTKSFLVSLSACLKAELTDKQLKIKVQSLCPGYVRTDFHSRGTYDDTNYDDLENQGFIVLTPQEVVKKSLQLLFDSEKKGIIVVPGYETAQVKSYLIDNSYLLQELEE